MARKRRRKDLADQLRTAIRRSSQTHYAIAMQAGIAPDQIDRFVSGERILRLDTAAKIAGVLGLELRPKGDSR